jgi:DNA-binding transcriptional regulator LsrR (DeoR family)
MDAAMPLQPEDDARPAPSARGAAPVPIEFGGDPIVWAAWLYYEDSLNQSEVAERIGVSRATVVNYLQEARQRGLVRISIAPEALGSLRLSREVAARFGLAGCYLIPAAGGSRPLHERLGEAGARVLAERLAPADILGVSWGRTVLALARALQPQDMSGITVVQVTGSEVGTAAFSPELCTSILANRLNARCVNLHAPAFLSTQAVRDILLAEPALVSQFELIRSCTKIVYGVAGLTEGSMVFESGFMSRSDGAPYIAAGAVGVAIGRFFDAGGAHVPGTHDARMVGISLDELRGIPERLCVAGGPDKETAIAGALRGGFATHLVTDERTARRLLEL